MSMFHSHTPNGKAEEKKRIKEARRQEKEQIQDARDLLRRVDQEDYQASQPSQPSQRNSSRKISHRTQYDVRRQPSGHSQSSSSTNSSRERNVSNAIPSVVRVSDDVFKLKSIYGILIGYYLERPGYWNDYDHGCHPVNAVKDVLVVMKEWSLDMVAANSGDTVIVGLLRALPKMIELHNIEDGTINGVQEKQAQFVFDIIEVFDKMMPNLLLGNVLLHHLMNDEQFTELFLEDAGKGGYNSKTLKNNFAMGIFFLLIDFRRKHSNMSDEDMNNLIKLLGKLSSKIDAKEFGVCGGYKEVTYLFSCTKNEDHHKTLHYIMDDMFQHQQYTRQQTARYDSTTEIMEALEWWQENVNTFDPSSAANMGNDVEMFGKAKNILALFGLNEGDN